MIARALPLESPAPGDLADSLGNPVDLLLRRVAGAADAHHALRGDSQSPGDRGRIEVSVRGEDPPRGQAPADLGGGTVADREGERGRAGASGGGPSSRTPSMRAQGFPEPGE